MSSCPCMRISSSSLLSKSLALSTSWVSPGPGWVLRWFVLFVLVYLQCSTTTFIGKINLYIAPVNCSALRLAWGSVAGMVSPFTPIWGLELLQLNSCCRQMVHLTGVLPYPLQKKLLWALSLLDMWNKRNGFGKGLYLACQVIIFPVVQGNYDDNNLYSIKRHFVWFYHSFIHLNNLPYKCIWVGKQWVGPKCCIMVKWQYKGRIQP